MLTFVRQFFANHHHTGALLPSGRGLARRMTRSVRGVQGTKRVLEVGPGTGAFTGQVLDALRAGDELHIVEINPTFARGLEERFLKPFRQAHPDIRVLLHGCDIEEASLEGSFDCIVCGLPFNNFPLAQVRRIFRIMMGLLKENGELSFFEYAGVRLFKAPFTGFGGRDTLRRRAATVQMLRRRHESNRDLVLGNMPPAYAIHLRA